MKEIVYIADTELPSTRANSVNIVKMCEAFSELGNDVELIIFSTKKTKNITVGKVFQKYKVDTPFKIKRIPLLIIPGASIIYSLLVFFTILFKKNKKEKLFFGRSVFSLALLTFLKVPVIIDLHGQIWKKSKLRKMALTKIVSASCTKKIIFNSPQLIEIFKKGFGTKINKRVTLVAAQNGATIPKKSMPFQLNHTSGLKVGYIGSLLKGRGVDLIINLAKLCPEESFHIAGGTKDMVTEFYKEEIPKNIFFYGFLPHNETYNFRNACDILLAPYQVNVYVPGGENTVAFMSPIKIFEYMASNKAIVCSDLPVLRNVLNEKNAKLVDAENTEGWAKAIKQLQSKELREQLSSQAYSDFLSNYTWIERARKILSN